MNGFKGLGFSPEVKPLAFFQDDYGLKGDEEDENEDDDEDDDDGDDDGKEDEDEEDVEYARSVGTILT